MLDLLVPCRLGIYEGVITVEQSAGNPALPTAPVYVVARELITPDIRLPEVLEVALESGADGFELAQDQIAVIMNPDDAEDLLPLLARFAERPTLTVSRPLFVASSFQRELLLATLVQCHALGCALVAFPLGDVTSVTDEMLDVVQGIVTAAQERAPEVRITVMNDRRPDNSDVRLWRWLLERTSRWNAPVLMTLDLVGWVCAGGDITNAAHILGRYIAYLRVARAVSRNGGYVAKPPQPADDIYPALTHLPPHVPRALAFGIAESDRERLVVIMSEFLEAIRTGTFALKEGV